MSLICLDLEGPLSPQDNAYELMRLFPGGSTLFEVISRYDDLLTLEGRKGYEPGDTLALIVPFLVYHGISEEDIVNLAEKASLVAGAPKLIAELQGQGWQVYCISTTYEHYALRISRRAGIPPENVASTHFPLNRYRAILCKDNWGLVARVAEAVSSLRPVADDARIKEVLDRFFWAELPTTPLGAVVAKTKPIGGRRKAQALKRFARDCGCPLADWVAVGDSITDFRMLEAVDRAGGLAIAFNANEYALPYATMGLASTHLSDLGPALQRWQEGSRRAVKPWIEKMERKGVGGDRENFHWLAGRKDLTDVLEVHKRIRRLVRREAGKLG